MAHLGIEVIIPVDSFPDERLLVDDILPIVRELRPRLSNWHYFWEPDLYVRFIWTNESSAREGRTELEARLGLLRESGRIASWTIAVYPGDAKMYGAEMWPILERHFTANAELTSAILEHERAGTLTKNRGYHWARNVHTFTNELFATWANEARLSLLQARYRTWLLRHTKLALPQKSELDALAAKLDAALPHFEALAAAEQEMVARWKAAGRPDIAELLALPEGFDLDPGTAR